MYKHLSCAALKIKLTTGSGNAGTCVKLHDRSRIRLRQKAGVCVCVCVCVCVQAPLNPGDIAGTHFCYSLSRSQGHSAAGRIMSMKNPIDLIINGTRYFPACTAFYK